MRHVTSPCRVLVLLVTVGAVTALAPAASATIAPTLTLDQSAPNGTVAGATTNVGMDLKFGPSAGDSPKNLSVVLPPGLLANAGLAGGACLSATTATPACQVATGTVTASGLPASVTLYLVRPPKATDLAGLALQLSGSIAGPPLATGDVSLRPSSDPAGVGLDLTVSNLPNLNVSELQATFTGIRLPSSCPSTPANIAVVANSAMDATLRTASAPLTVGGCSSLRYAPKLTATATKDASDSGVRLVAAISQASGESAHKSITLTIPTATLTPNLTAAAGLLNSATPVGTATAVSPIFPTPLQAQVFAVATPTLGLAVRFPAPFSLTLTGAISLTGSSSSVAFNGLPDIPLSDLAVTLNGGPKALFSSACVASTGSLSGSFTGQNGASAGSSATVSIAGCPTPLPPRVGSGALSGLVAGKPKLAFRLTAGRNAPKLASFSVKLPSGLSLIGPKLRKGVSLSGAKIKSVKVSGGKLVVTLKAPAKSLGVKIGPPALRVSQSLSRKVKLHKLKTLRLTVVIKDAGGKSKTVRLTIAKLR